MNPTDHAAKRAKLVQEIAEVDAGACQIIGSDGRTHTVQYRDGWLFEVGFGTFKAKGAAYYAVNCGWAQSYDDVTETLIAFRREREAAALHRAELQAQLTALDATPAYPSVTFIDPKTRTQNFVTFRDGAFYVGSGSRPWYTAVELAHHLVEVEKLDEFVTRLLTLKGAAASGEPYRWISKASLNSRFAITYETEKDAVADRGTEAIPLYRHPPTPVAYQKVGACVTAGDGYMTWTYGARQVANAREWAAQHGGTAHMLYAGEKL